MNPEEEQVWRAMQKKDEQVFKHYYLANYRFFLLVAFRYLGDQGQALEIVNDVFVVIWEDAGSMDIRTSLKAYIHRAVVNRCLNVLIKDKRDRQRRQQLGQVAEEVAETNELEETELKVKLYEAIEQLPEQCKKVFKLSRFEGLKKHEIADQLGISVKTVKNHLNRALKVLKKVLDSLGHLRFFIVL